MEKTTLAKIEDIVGFRLTISCHDGEYNISAENNLICVGAFSLAELPGCCGVCVSYHASVFNNFTNKGIGTLMNILRQQIAYRGGYSLLLCTDLVSNVHQQKILNKNGWTKNLEFKNSRTDNYIALHTIELNEELKIGFDETIFQNIKKQGGNFFKIT